MRFASDPPEGPSLVERAAQRSTRDLVAQRAEEAVALMVAGAAVMTRLGITRRASVAEIVAEAGLSNQAFYRHYATKDDLVAAIVDDGARRLSAHLARRMQGLEPAKAVGAWVAGVLSQATNPAVAAPTRAISWNRTILANEAQAHVADADALIWTLLHEPLGALGVVDPRREAYLIGTLVFGVLAEALWADPRPKAKDLAFVSEFILRRIATI